MALSHGGTQRPGRDPLRRGVGFPTCPSRLDCLQLFTCASSCSLRLRGKPQISRVLPSCSLAHFDFHLLTSPIGWVAGAGAGCEAPGGGRVARAISTSPLESTLFSLSPRGNLPCFSLLLTCSGVSPRWGFASFSLRAPGRRSARPGLSNFAPLGLPCSAAEQNRLGGRGWSRMRSPGWWMRCPRYFDIAT